MRANFVMSGVWDGIRRNATMTIALILSTAIALAFVGAAILANIEINRFEKNYEGKLNVSVYLCAKHQTAPCTHQTTPAETAAIKQELQSDPAVQSVAYVSEREQYRRALQTLSPRIAKLTRVGQLPASFTVKLADLRRDYTAFAETFSSKPGVSGVTNRIDAIRKLLNLIDGVRLFSIAIAVVVLIASVLLIANTIQVAAAQRRNETSIMRLVGASRWMTELPFMLETIIATVLGGLVAVGLVALGKYYLLGSVFELQVENDVVPNLNVNDVLVASGVGIIGGIVVAAITAFATLRLYVRL